MSGAPRWPSAARRRAGRPPAGSTGSAPARTPRKPAPPPARPCARPSCPALLGDQAEEVAVTRDLVGLRDVPAGEVGAAHVEDLALAHQLLHALPDLFPGRAARDVVHLVEVDVVRLQTPQGRLTLALERQRV